MPQANRDLITRQTQATQHSMFSISKKYLSKLLWRAVVSIMQLLLQRAKIHRPFDDRIIVGHKFSIDRSVKYGSVLAERRSHLVDHSAALVHELILGPGVAGTS